MGGASSEISDATTDVLLEAAYFDPMSIARSSKRHGLRSEASNLFERGVDPSWVFARPLASCRYSTRAARVGVAGQSARRSRHDADAADDPVVRGDIERVLGVTIDGDEVASILRGLRFDVSLSDGDLTVTRPRRDPTCEVVWRAGPTSSRRSPDSTVIVACPSRADVARTGRTEQSPEVTPSRARRGRRPRRRRMLDADLGSDGDFDLLEPGVARVRITNPLAADESVLRATMITASFARG